MANSQPAPGRDAEPLAAADDAELVRRAQLGSAAAFEQLVLHHGPALHRYLRLELRHESDAHDALQETLTAAWRGLPSLRQANRFWPWLVGIASHKAADVHRRRSRDSRPETPAEARDDLLLEAREALAALPAHYRQVLLLRYLLGLTEQEAAAALGVRVGTVKSRGSRARRALLEELR
ncbi:MAG TPA: RNA polymerase sigma factor [Gaiellaceae bacterium]|nr:RNA polymerase sigma factor [Gaiellaceae bacterium]